MDLWGWGDKNLLELLGLIESIFLGALETSSGPSSIIFFICISFSCFSFWCFISFLRRKLYWFIKNLSIFFLLSAESLRCFLYIMLGEKVQPSRSLCSLALRYIAILIAFSFSLSSNRSHCSYAPRLDSTFLSLLGEDFGEGYSRSLSE